MSYAQEVSKRINELKEEQIEKYKQVFEDYLLPQITDTSVGVAENHDLINQGVDCIKYRKWLTDEGFATEDFNKGFTVKIPPQGK